MLRIVPVHALGECVVFCTKRRKKSRLCQAVHSVPQHSSEEMRESSAAYLTTLLAVGKSESLQEMEPCESS